jgi:tripartite-type tricarboxylate transporter receptor subunit TctC
MIGQCTPGSRSTGRRKLLLGAIMTAAFAVASTMMPAPAQAQDWPSRPIEMVVGFAPGGGTDLVGRAIADALSKQLSVPVQVVNRAGGGGVVGFDAVRNAKPDGYTIGIITAQVITANLRGVMQATYEDFEHLGMINIEQGAVAVPANSPYNSLEDLIKAARERPDSVTAGNGSEGGSHHMSARNLESQTGVTFRHIPFDGGPAAILQLVGGHIDAAFLGAVEIAPHAEAGTVKVLAVVGQDRDPRFEGLPDAPTTAELGFPLQIGTWRSIGMPKGADPAIVAKLVAATEKAVQDEQFVKTMTDLKLPVRYFGPEKMNEYLAGQVETYRAILK